MAKNDLASLFGPPVYPPMQATPERINQAILRGEGRTDQAVQVPEETLASAFNMPSDERFGYDVDPERQKKYLAQKSWRGINDAAFGLGDLLNKGINTGISNVDYWTGGGLSGGTYEPYQLGNTTDATAALGTMLYEALGYELVPEETMTPDTRQAGANRQALFGMIPTGAEDVIGPAAKGSLAVLHGLPDLFKRPALEDAAKNVSPDKVWHDWGWELSPDGKWWRETTGKPTLKGAPEPPHPSDPAQASLFTEDQAPEVNLPHPQLAMTGFHEMRPAYTSQEPPTQTLSDVVDNPQLYNQPGLEFLGGIPTRTSTEPLSELNPNASGLYYRPTESRPEGSIAIRTDSADPVATAQHESTHAAAAHPHYPLPQGFNPKSADAAAQGAYVRNLVEGDKQAYEDAINKRTADYWKHEDAMFDKYGDLKPSDYDETTGRHKPRPGEMSLTEFKAQWGKQNPMLQKILDDNKHLSDFTDLSDEELAYHTSMGEVAARNAAARDTGAYTPQQLREKRPARTEDVPRQYQWTEGTGNMTPPAPSIADDLAAAASEPPVARRRIGDNNPPGESLPVERGAKPKKKAAGIADDLAAATTPPATVPKTYKHPISGIKLDIPLEEMQADLVPFGKMKEKRIIRPEELLGKTAILMRGDPAAAGQTLLGTMGRKYTDPVNLYGGEGYPRMEMNIEADRVWASKQAQAQALANRAAEAAKESDEGVVGIYQRMHPRSTAYNTMLPEALLQEFKLNRSKISNADVKEFDRLMREESWALKKNGKFDRPAYPDWPGLDKLTPEYLRAAPDGKVRNKMFDLMDSREWRNKGFPDAGLANFATSDAALRDLPPNTVGGATVKLDTSGVTSKESGHPTYESGVLGEEMGVMPNIPLDVYDPNYRLTGGTGGGPISNQHLEKFLQTKPPIIKLDEPTLDRFMKYLRSQEGFKWGIGGAVAAGIISEEQARQIDQAQGKGAAQ